MKSAAIEHHKYSANVKPLERIVSILAGSVILYDAVTKRRRFRSAEMLAGGYLLSRGIYGYCPAYDLMGKEPVPDMVRNINITLHETIYRPRMEVYDFWRRLENLPKLMNHIKSVVQTTPVESEWTIKGPGGIGTVSWKAAIVKEEPGFLLGWSSLPGSVLENAGKVSFLDNPHGTDLEVVISYRPPVGAVGAVIAKLLNRSFEKLVRKDLANVKMVLENASLATA
jgi:uncharacterized membrane protein